MLDLINGLPAHPLLVHAPVVLVPLTSLLLIALAFFPKLQKNYLNLAVAGATVSLVVSKLAESSGEELSERVGLPVEHAEAGERLVQVCVLLLLITLAWFYLIRKNSKSVLIRITGYLVSLIAVAAMFVTYQAGHSGAKTTWEKRISPIVAPATNTDSGLPTDGSSIVLSEAEVAKHASGSDCWSIVNGNVYNLTSYVNSHPGGAANIESICGKDGTSAFKAQHNGEGTPNNVLSNFMIGALGASVTGAELQNQTSSNGSTSIENNEETEENEEGEEK